MRQRETHGRTRRALCTNKVINGFYATPSNFRSSSFRSCFMFYLYNGAYDCQLPAGLALSTTGSHSALRARTQLGRSTGRVTVDRAKRVDLWQKPFINHFRIWFMASYNELALRTLNMHYKRYIYVCINIYNAYARSAQRSVKRGAHKFRLIWFFIYLFACAADKQAHCSVRLPDTLQSTEPHTPYLISI